MAYYNNQSFGQYNPYYMQNQNNIYQQPQYQQMQFQQSAIQQPTVINGKFVDGIDIVKSSEVPIGSYGVFPTADFKKVYVKTWTNDGRTQIDEYAKTDFVDSTETKDISNILENISNSINELEKKIDNISFHPSNNQNRQRRKDVQNE